jgi:hypothetical protein
VLAQNYLGEVNKYSPYSPSSLLVGKLISVERMDSAFLFLLLAVYWKYPLPSSQLVIRIYIRDTED